MALRVLIADDHQLFRSGLRQLLIDELGASEVREAETFDDALESLTDQSGVDLILVDLEMPGMAGAETLTALADGFPNAKVAVVSASEDRAEILAALSAGVQGFVPKSLSALEIAAALKSVLDGAIYVPASVGRREVTAAPSRAASGVALTARQNDVLKELMQGKSSKQIARALDIAEGTVKIHLAAIYRAIGVRTRAEAIAKLSTR